MSSIDPILGEIVIDGVTYKVKTTITPQGRPTPPPPKEVKELKILKVVSSGDDGNVAENVLNSNVSRWSCDQVPCTLDAYVGWDHDHPQEIGEAKIRFFRGNERTSNFDLAISLDGQTFTNIMTGRQEGGMNVTVDIEPNVKAMVFRYIGKGNSINDWTSIEYLQLFGKQLNDGGIPPEPEPEPEPEPGGGGQDGDVQLKYKPIGNGIEHKFSSGNSGRYQLYASLPKCFVNLIEVGYFKIAKVSNRGEEISGKNRGGRHSDSVAEEASCYIQGIGYDGSVNSQYEQPHPRNHSLDHEVVTDKPYGDNIVGKWVGLQNVIYFKNGEDHLETWVDLEADKIDTEGKPGNKWVLFWKANTKQFAGKCNSPGPDTRSYWRLDDIPDGDDEKNVERRYCKVYEIEVP